MTAQKNRPWHPVLTCVTCETGQYRPASEDYFSDSYHTCDECKSYVNNRFITDRAAQLVLVQVQENNRAYYKEMPRGLLNPDGTTTLDNRPANWRRATELMR